MIIKFPYSGAFEDGVMGERCSLFLLQLCTATSCICLILLSKPAPLKKDLKYQLNFTSDNMCENMAVMNWFN